MKIRLYTTPFCPYCNAAKELLDDKGLEYEDHNVATDINLRKQISDSVGGYATVPMIFIDEKFIGGFSELSALDKSGGLG